MQTQINEMDDFYGEGEESEGEEDLEVEERFDESTVGNSISKKEDLIDKSKEEPSVDKKEPTSELAPEATEIQLKI